MRYFHGLDCVNGRAVALSALILLLVTFTAPTAPPSPNVLDYIKQTWRALTRSNQTLATSAADPKFHAPASGEWPVYVAADADLPGIERELRAEIDPSHFEKIELRKLPADPSGIREPGLLYLPHPYVVPGGRFNEMYGWDSFFIQMGLLRDGEVQLAKDMADNFLYEIAEYGKILNANRTYYLTRSQPPFLTGMLLAVYRRTNDRQWLEQSVPQIERYYRYWTTEPHLTPETGLSRYFDSGEGPGQEVVASEVDGKGRGEYDVIKAYFREHKITDYDASQYYDAARDQLTPLFYKADRSMRESGFDPSNRFGPFSADIIHYDPTCLNSLLYQMEMQTAEIMDILHRDSDASEWRRRGSERAERINRLMWDPQAGLYYDYDFVHRRVRQYPFLTTFYPLWTGIASRDQAARVVRNLPLFERPGGLQTSAYRSGDQWDAPFGWAPLQWIAVEGLRRYGYNAEAERISKNFLSLAQQEFLKYRTLVEKYDVVHRSSRDVATHLRYGYHSNEAGFGWTNAVFTALFDQLSPDDQQALLHSP